MDLITIHETTLDRLSRIASERGMLTLISRKIGGDRTWVGKLNKGTIHDPGIRKIAKLIDVLDEIEAKRGKDSCATSLPSDNAEVMV